MFDYKFAAVRMHVHNVEICQKWYINFLKKTPYECLKDLCVFIIDNIRFEICIADEKSPQSVGGSVVYFEVILIIF